MEIRTETEKVHIKNFLTYTPIFFGGNVGQLVKNPATGSKRSTNTMRHDLMTLAKISELPNIIIKQL